jgi:hypothetical protein
MNDVRLHLQYSEDIGESRAGMSAHSSCVYPGQVPSGVSQRTVSDPNTSFEPSVVCDSRVLTNYRPKPIGHWIVPILMASESTHYIPLSWKDVPQGRERTLGSGSYYKHREGQSLR